jgi:pectinesterase
MAQIVISDSHKIIENQVYTGDRSAWMPHPDGRPYHTFRTATVLVDGEDVTFRNCTFRNTAGPRGQAGQAIALYCDGDGLVFEHCRMEGYQDTVFLAPLPPKEIEKDGFIGPKQFAPRTPRSVVFRDCYISGSVDFVFGGAAALFERCEFRSRKEGFVFAPSTPEGAKQGFVCRDCRFTAEPSVPDSSCFLGRPWRNFAQCTLEHCYIGPHIRREGWSDWGKADAHATLRFAETDSYGPGADSAGRARFVTVAGRTQ